MSREQLVTIAVTSLMSGSVFAAAATWITSRATARKTMTETRVLETKLPPEAGNIVVEGATAAVLTMQRALESADGRIKQLEKERESDRERMAELEAKVRRLEAKVSTAEKAASEARQDGAVLRKEIEQLIKEQRKRS